MSPPTKPVKPAKSPEHAPQSKPSTPHDEKAVIEQREAEEDSAPAAVSPAKAMQEQSIAPPTAEKLSVVLRTDSGYEHNLDLPREVVEKLLDPDVPDGFIEVPGVSYGGQRLHGMRRFLHTAYIKEIDVKGL